MMLQEWARIRRREADQNSTAAGLALGVAACIKPQLVILAPLALLLLRDLRAILAAALTVVALVSAATLMFGMGIWLDWLNSLSGFQAIAGKLAIGQLALPPTPLVIIGAGAIVVMLMVVAARDSDRPRLIIATIGGSLLLSPYSAHYESVVLLLPALALLRFDWRILPIGILLFGGAVTTLAFATVILLLGLPPRFTDARALFARTS